MDKPRILVIGCGFGGLETVRALSPHDVEITLVDRTNHHLFQPLLYQVATAGLSAPAVSAPIRHTLRREMKRGNLTVLQAEVRHIDTKACVATLDDGDTLEFDQLIVAAGATHSYFGHDDWAAHAPGLKTLEDAFGIRARVIGAFEHAERCTGPSPREPWMTFAVIGAGPTGVEMAGTMIEIAHHTLPEEFRRIDSRSAHVVLLEGSDRVLGGFVPAQSEKAREQLIRLGVDVRTGCQVTAIDADGVTYQTRDGADGAPQTKRLPCKTVIWAAGVAASPLGRVLAESTGATLDRAGRVTVRPDLSIAGCPHVWVIGDLASARSHPKGLSNEQALASTVQTTAVPGVSPAAKQMGWWRPTCCADCAAKRHRRSTTPTTATSPPSAGMRPWSI
jgi:NADH dehydrogenase